MQNIDSKQFKEMLDKERDSLEIIDVREKDEADLVRVKGSKLIPMNELPTRLNEIDWNKKVVFLCRSGARSEYMADIIERQTQKDIINLAGGIYQLNLDDCDCLEKAEECCDGYF